MKVLKVFLILVLFPLMAHAAEGASNSDASAGGADAASSTTLERVRERPPRFNRNSVAIELLGRGGLYSFNYDRLLGRQAAVGLGFSYLSLNVRAGDVVDTHINVLVVPTYANLYFNSSMRHRLMGTGGVSLVYVTADADSGLAEKANEQGKQLPFKLDANARASALLPIPVAGVGYEYRSRGGILGRLALYGMLAPTIFPWAGASVGAHF